MAVYLHCPHPSIKTHYSSSQGPVYIREVYNAENTHSSKMQIFCIYYNYAWRLALLWCSSHFTTTFIVHVLTYVLFLLIRHFLLVRHSGFKSRPLVRFHWSFNGRWLLRISKPSLEVWLSPIRTNRYCWQRSSPAGFIWLTANLIVLHVVNVYCCNQGFVCAYFNAVN